MQEMIKIQTKYMITPAEYQMIITDPRCSEGHKFILDLKISEGEIEIKETTEQTENAN